MIMLTKKAFIIEEMIFSISKRWNLARIVILCSESESDNKLNCSSSNQMEIDSIGSELCQSVRTCLCQTVEKEKKKNRRFHFLSFARHVKTFDFLTVGLSADFSSFVQHQCRSTGRRRSHEIESKGQSGGWCENGQRETLERHDRFGQRWDGELKRSKKTTFFFLCVEAIVKGEKQHAKKQGDVNKDVTNLQKDTIDAVKEKEAKQHLPKHDVGRRDTREERLEGGKTSKKEKKKHWERETKLRSLFSSFNPAQ